MSNYGYIDESGTLSHQEVMTVALVILNGARAAKKLHKKLVQSTIPNPPKTRGLREVEKWYASQQLHFVDMETTRKLELGKALSTENIEVFIASYKHKRVDCSHEARFVIYKNLVKSTVNSAFGTYKELTICIAKQGGWEDYGKALLEELRLLPETFSKQGTYRKGDFYLASSSTPGLQIADFYASSSRNAMITCNDAKNLCAPYELVKHQIRKFDEITT
jgi:hypothetical protein